MVALLLFLVCAAVGAVILAAAAATAGRMSEKTKTDQRYYSVSSAAELLADQLCGKKVKIERVRTTTTEVTLSMNGTTVTTSDPVTTTEYKTYVNRKTDTDPPFNGITDGLSFLSARAVKLLFGSHLSEATGFYSEAIMQFTFSNEEEGNNLSLNHGADYSDLTVEKISWHMQTNGNLELTISTGEDKNKYAVVLTLIPEIDESAETLEEPPVTMLDNTTGKFVKTTKTTTTKSSTIQWKVGRISKEVS